MEHTCIKDDGGTPNRKCDACEEEKELRLKLDESQKKNLTRNVLGIGREPLPPEEIIRRILNMNDSSIIAFSKKELLSVISDGIYLTKNESTALHKFLKNEFIPHEYYEEIHSILNKINVKLVR